MQVTSACSPRVWITLSNVRNVTDASLRCCCNLDRGEHLEPTCWSNSCWSNSFSWTKYATHPWFTAFAEWFLCYSIILCTPLCLCAIVLLHSLVLVVKSSGLNLHSWAHCGYSNVLPWCWMWMLLGWKCSIPNEENSRVQKWSHIRWFSAKVYKWLGQCVFLTKPFYFLWKHLLQCGYANLSDPNKFMKFWIICHIGAIIWGHKFFMIYHMVNTLLTWFVLFLVTTGPGGTFLGTIVHQNWH